MTAAGDASQGELIELLRAVLEAVDIPPATVRDDNQELYAGCAEARLQYIKMAIERAIGVTPSGGIPLRHVTDQLREDLGHAPVQYVTRQQALAEHAASIGSGHVDG